MVPVPAYSDLCSVSKSAEGMYNTGIYCIYRNFSISGLDAEDGICRHDVKIWMQNPDLPVF